MKINFNIFVFLRFFLAMIFIVSGTEKLLSPVENFVYALQSYQIIPFPELQIMIAHVFPWAELIIGVFLLLGLWTRIMLAATGLMACGFIFFVGQGIIRQLPLIDCGCFGDILHLPLWGTLVLDWVILLGSIWLYKNCGRTTALSLDHALTS